MLRLGGNRPQRRGRLIPTEVREQGAQREDIGAGAIALKPEASSYVLLGIIRQELGQGVAAAVAYRAALELEPASETTRRLLAHIESGGGLANVPTTDR